MAFTGQSPPEPAEQEKPRVGEVGMLDPIKIVPDDARWGLDRLTRINYLKIYTVELCVKANGFGHVAEEFMWLLMSHFNSNWGIPSNEIFPTTADASLIHHDYNAEKEDPFISKKLLGRGSYGFVDQVEARLQNRAVFARKLFRLHTVFPKREKQIEKIKEEARIANRLQHWHIVRVIETYQWRQHFGIIMLPIAQSDLSTLLDQIDTADGPGRIALLEHIPGWCGCLIQAMNYLHQELIRHKDIKPSNILIKDGKVYLTDFGFAKDMSNEESSGTDGSVGPFTPRYCAPECVQDSARRGRPADIFSLGCVFLELATVLICPPGGRAHLIENRPHRSTESRTYCSSAISIVHWLLYLWSLSYAEGLQTELSSTTLCQDTLTPRPFDVSFSETPPDVQGAPARMDCLFAGSLIADLAFFMLDPEPSLRLNAPQLSFLLQTPNSDYSRYLLVRSCSTCRYTYKKSKENMEDSSSPIHLPSLRLKGSLISDYLADPEIPLQKIVIHSWDEARTFWLQSRQLSIAEFPR
jgi:serine/threonine protein kinase